MTDTSSHDCSSIIFSSSAVWYSKVCGRILGYQSGSTNSFQGNRSRNVSGNYVDGVSLTHGNPRQHIWTFAAGLHEYNSNSESRCPCQGGTTSPPEFVGMDYFCDTGSSGRFNESTFYVDDPLWDGVGCGAGDNSTCCSFNNPPWFYRQLPELTTDDIEMRLCRDEEAEKEDVTIGIAEIYIC